MAAVAREPTARFNCLHAYETTSNGNLHETNTPDLLLITPSPYFTVEIIASLISSMAFEHLPRLAGLNAFTRPLSPTDVQSCVTVESAFPEHERCSQQKVPTLNCSHVPLRPLLQSTDLPNSSSYTA